MFKPKPSLKKSTAFYTLFLLVFTFTRLCGQQHGVVDALTIALNNATADTSKFNIYHQLYNVTDSLGYARDEMEISSKLKDKNLYAQALLDVGRYYYFFTDNHDSSLSYLKRGVQLAEALGNQMVMANGYRYLGFVFRNVDAFMSEAYYQKSLVICKKMHADLLASYDYSALGNIREGKPTEFNKKTALEYYLQSLEIRERLGSYAEIASSLLETSRVYGLIGNYAKAFELKEKGLALAENAGDVTNIVYLCNLIGNDYYAVYHNDKKALEYEIKAYNLAKTEKNNFDIVNAITRSLATIYADMGNTKDAVTYYKLYCSFTDSLKTQTNNEVYNISDAKHSLELELERQKTIANNAEVSKQKQLKNTFIIGFGILLIFAAFLFWAYRQKNLANNELTISNKKIEIAYDLIEARNRDILDSLQYASYLQKAVLARKEKMAKALKDVFILNLPKDIVSGDFYFFTEEQGKYIIAACDCTGHGVPGALVSIVCSNALNRAIKEFHIIEPAKILDKTRELVLETFKRSEGKVHDGMDVSLCSLDTKTLELQWSGAYNPLWYIHKNEITEISPDKQPIGIQDNSTLFTNHVMKMEEGDALYLFSDGYVDQFGGPKVKKFSKHQFQELLLSIHKKSMPEQETVLLDRHNQWKGENLQVDDILIMGIRV